jgi:mRNA interferase RelE/StbE
MIYKINIKKSAIKELESLPKHIKSKIAEKILALKTDPRPDKVKKLISIEAYRIRVNDYRVLYTIDDSNKIIEILSIGHRKDIY